MDPLPFLFRFISSGKVDEVIFNDSIFSSNFHRDKVTFLDQRPDRSLIHCPESAQNQPSNGAGCDPTRRGGECSASGKPGRSEHRPGGTTGGRRVRRLCRGTRGSTGVIHPAGRPAKPEGRRFTAGKRLRRTRRVRGASDEPRSGEGFPRHPPSGFGAGGLGGLGGRRGEMRHDPETH